MLRVEVHLIGVWHVAKRDIVGTLSSGAGGDAATGLRREAGAIQGTGDVGRSSGGSAPAAAHGVAQIHAGEGKIIVVACGAGSLSVPYSQAAFNK